MSIGTRKRWPRSRSALAELRQASEREKEREREIGDREIEGRGECGSGGALDVEKRCVAAEAAHATVLPVLRLIARRARLCSWRAVRALHKGQHAAGDAHARAARQAPVPRGSLRCVTSASTARACAPPSAAGGNETMGARAHTGPRAHMCAFVRVRVSVCAS